MVAMLVSAAGNPILLRLASAASETVQVRTRRRRLALLQKDPGFGCGGAMAGSDNVIA